MGTDGLANPRNLILLSILFYTYLELKITNVLIPDAVGNFSRSAIALMKIACKDIKKSLLLHGSTINRCIRILWVELFRILLRQDALSKRSREVPNGF